MQLRTSSWLVLYSVVLVASQEHDRGKRSPVDYSSGFKPCPCASKGREYNIGDPEKLHRNHLKRDLRLQTWEPQTVLNRKRRDVLEDDWKTRQQQHLRKFVEVKELDYSKYIRTNVELGHNNNTHITKDRDRVTDSSHHQWEDHQGKPTQSSHRGFSAQAKQLSEQRERQHNYTKPDAKGESKKGYTEFERKLATKKNADEIEIPKARHRRDGGSSRMRELFGLGSRKIEENQKGLQILAPSKELNGGKIIPLNKLQDLSDDSEPNRVRSLPARVDERRNAEAKSPKTAMNKSDRTALAPFSKQSGD